MILEWYRDFFEKNDPDDAGARFFSHWSNGSPPSIKQHGGGEDCRCFRGYPSLFPTYLISNLLSAHSMVPSSQLSHLSSFTYIYKVYSRYALI